MDIYSASELCWHYLDNPDRFLMVYVITFKNIKKIIVTYRKDENGDKLRAAHELINRVLFSAHSFSKASFAYKRGSTILDCVNKHLGNDSFYKTDICRFFNYVNKDSLIKSLKYSNRWSKKVLDFFSADKNPRYASHCFFNALNLCFYEGGLPIGFVTSPVLSDIYMKSFDSFMVRKAEKSFVYTRYADDILISYDSKQVSEKNLTALVNYMTDELIEKGFSINAGKTIRRSLNQPGDYIRFLGLNIVKTDGAYNRITVSRKYLERTCKELSVFIDGHIDKPLSKKDYIKLNGIMGKVNFIRNNSKDSFRKFEKMFHIRSSYSIHPTRKDIIALLNGKNVPETDLSYPYYRGLTRYSKIIREIMLISDLFSDNDYNSSVRDYLKNSNTIYATCIAEILSDLNEFEKSTEKYAADAIDLQESVFLDSLDHILQSWDLFTVRKTDYNNALKILYILDQLEKQYEKLHE